MRFPTTTFLAFLTALATGSLAFVACGGDDDDDDRQLAPGGNGGAGGASGASGRGGSPGGSGGTAGGGGQGGGGAGGAPDCVGNEPSKPPECTGECKAFSPCDGVTNFRLGLGKYIVTCLNKLTVATCDAGADVVECANGVLKLSCVDQGATAACDTTAEQCGLSEDAAAKARCVSRLSGLSDQGRTLFQACLTDRCTTGAGAIDATSLDFCVAALFQTPVIEQLPPRSSSARPATEASATLPVPPRERDGLPATLPAASRGRNEVPATLPAPSDGDDGTPATLPTPSGGRDGTPATLLTPPGGRDGTPATLPTPAGSCEGWSATLPTALNAPD